MSARRQMIAGLSSLTNLEHVDLSQEKSTVDAYRVIVERINDAAVLMDPSLVYFDRLLIVAGSVELIVVI